MVRKPKLFFRKFGMALAIIILLEDAQAGIWISRIEGEPGSYTVRRDNQILGVQVYTDLQAGDSILVSGQNSRIELEADDGKTTVIDRDTSPFVVADAGVPPNWSSNLTKWVASWFSSEATKSREVATLVTRGQGRNLRLIGAEANLAKIATDSAPLCLKWSGGEPPFYWRIVSAEDGTEILGEEAEAENSVEIASFAFSPGQYLLEVGGGGLSTSIILDVVSLEQVPRMPAELEESRMSPKMRSTLGAVWLLDQADAVWGLEAVRRLCTLSRDYAPARMMLNNLGISVQHL